MRVMGVNRGVDNILDGVERCYDASMEQTPRWWLPSQAPSPNASHYYGDEVRRLFLVGSIIMLVALVRYPDIFPGVPVSAIVALILLSVFLAGLTNPQSRLSILLDLIVSGGAFLYVEYAAVIRFQEDPLFLSVIREAIAVAFIVAFYFASKSFRGMSR